MADTIQYGFVGLQHLFNERVTEVDQRIIATGLQQSLDEYNRQVDALLAGLVDRTTDRTRRILLNDQRELQPLDQWGNPLPTQPAGSYEVGFPIHGGGDAHGTNRVSRNLMTVEEFNRQLTETFTADAKWIRRHILAALLDNVSHTFADPAGDVTVQPLASGDAVTYPLVGGNVAADTHHTAGTAALAESTFTTLRRELLEHPQNAGQRVIVYLPTNLVDDAEALDALVEVGDPDVNEGADADTLVGRLERGFGDEVIGKVARCWIVEWSALPDNYMLATVAGRTPLAMREYPSAALQGLFRENHSPNGNLIEERYIRYAGFGVQDRIAAAVHQIGNETYQIPDGFDAPLAV